MKIRKILLYLILGAAALFVIQTVVLHTNEKKYGGHGFDYMNGYSSTDFTGYHVYDGEKLAVLDHEASLIIENEADMPVLDGAEACYPLYSAFAKAVYRNIGEIEKAYLNSRPEENGKIVTFTNSLFGYERLTDHRIDIMIGARPSESQKEYASDHMEQIETLTIAREAFVFFVEEDNPVTDLSSEQIRAIYHGDITNWQEVGGKNQRIVAFQRPENSGSQVMMKYFMGDLSLKEPETYETVSSMDGVVRRTAQYHNEAGALGYTFKYFLTGLNQEKHVRILTIDGVEPTAENIQNGTYPACADVVAAVLHSNEKPFVRKMLEFFLSADGQELIEKTGYVPLKEPGSETRLENEMPVTESYQTEDGGLRFTYNPATGYYAVAEYDGKKTEAYWTYYGYEVNPAELRNTWSLALKTDDGWAEIIFNEEGDHYTVCGYLDDNGYSESVPAGLPQKGTILRRES